MSADKAVGAARRPFRVRFLDRYAAGWPRNGCNRCDALGFYPSNDPEEIAAAVKLAKPGEVFRFDGDGYVNLTCSACGGSGVAPQAPASCPTVPSSGDAGGEKP